MNELISVIIPIYKVEQYLKRCIDSVLGQTYKNLEIVLVDDGSPDGCGKICDEYAAIDNRVKVIHKKNGGLSDSRNVGIEISQGEYIAFIDSDDWIHKKYFEELYNLLKKSNSDISVCNFIRVSNENIRVDNSKQEVYEYSNIEALEQFVGEFYVQMVIACGKLYKKDLFKEIRFPVGKLHEDEFTTYKVIFNAKKVILTTAQLYYYWQRQDSIMGVGFNIKGRLDVIEAFKERGDFFKKMQLEQLSSKTYKALFFLYLTVNNQIKELDIAVYKNEFDNGFKDLKNNLRESRQNFTFKLFYELYYVVPQIMHYVYRNYMWLRNN